MDDTAAVLTDVQLAELEFLGDEFEQRADDSFLAANVVPFAAYARRENVTLDLITATGFEHIPTSALAPLIIGVMANASADSRFARTVRKLADALAAG